MHSFPMIWIWNGVFGHFLQCRKMAAKQPIISAEDLKDVLECPVCLRIPRCAPIFQCERGHVVCNECHPKLVTCPVCRLPLGKTRSLISEKVLSRLPTVCKFCDYGCTIEMMKSDLESHEKECLYRLVRCVDLACNEKVPFAGLLDHMTNDHEREDFVNAEGSTYRSHFIVGEDDFSREVMWISDHLMLDGRHFFRECCRQANGLWFIWVYLLGTHKEAENYIYSIKITSEDKVCNYKIEIQHFFLNRDFWRRRNWLIREKWFLLIHLKKKWPALAQALSSMTPLPSTFGPT